MYICTVLLNPNKKILGSCFNAGEASMVEASMQLMSTDSPEPQYVVRFTSQSSGNRTYVAMSDFDNNIKLCSLLLKCNYMLEFRGVFFELSNFVGLPQRIRIYSKNQNLCALTNNFVEAEKSIVEYFMNEVGNIMIEVLEEEQKPTVYIAAKRRHLDNHQLKCAQSMLCNATGKSSYTLKNYVPISQEYAIDFTRVECNKIQSDAPVRNMSCNLSFIMCAKACGRRRTISSFLESLYSLEPDDPYTNLNYYSASKSSIIFTCDKEKWQNELTNYITIETQDDLESLTYKKLNEGVTVVFCGGLLLFNDLDIQINGIEKSIMLCYNNGKITVGNKACNHKYLRFHTQKLSHVFPQTVAPIKLVQFGCAVIDDILPNNFW